MSSTYFIGTYGKNSNENYYINKPIMLTRIMFSFLDDILNMSGIDVYEDFLFFSENKPFFYKINSSLLGKLDEEYEDYIEEIRFSNISNEMYPLICDCVERCGYKFFVRKDDDKLFDYSNFNKLEITDTLTRLYMSKNSYYVNNNKDFMVNELMSVYNEISDWIESNQSIYVYADY